MQNHADAGETMKGLDLLARLPFPANDGGAIGVCEPLLHTKRLGVEWVVAALYSERHEQDLRRTRQEFETYVDFSGTPPFGVFSALKNQFDHRPYNLALRFDRDSFRRMLKAIKQIHPSFDFIQVDWIFMAPYIDTCKELWPNTPILMRQHNAEYQIFERLTHNERNPAKRIFLSMQTAKMKRYETFHMNQVDLVVPVTELDAETFRSLGVKTRIVVNPAGANVEAWARPKGLPRNGRVLIVGGMGWPPYARSMEWFLKQCWSHFAKRNPNAGLDIIGKDPSPEIEAWHGRDGVVVHGFLEEIQPYMHESSVMVIPLLVGSGMRIKMVEAMAARLPVVTTSIGCEGIPVKDRIHAMVRDDAKGLSNALQDVINDPDLANSLALNAHTLAEDMFSWDSVGKRFVSLYKELALRG